MSSSQNDPLLALYRYFIVATHIHEQFKRVQDSQEYKQRQYSLSTNDFIIYLLLGPPSLYFIWCGMLLTVVEGYQELHLKDSQVNLLLVQSKLDVLKRCRNGIFHFQKNYFDDRLIALMRDLAFATWAVELSKALGTCIANELRAKGSIPSPQIDLRQFL